MKRSCFLILIFLLIRNNFIFSQLWFTCQVPCKTYTYTGIETKFDFKFRETDGWGLAYCLWDVDGDHVFDIQTEEGKVTHIYDEPGVYDIYFRAFSQSGDSTEISTNVIVNTGPGKQLNYESCSFFNSGFYKYPDTTAEVGKEYVYFDYISPIRILEKPNWLNYKFGEIGELKLFGTPTIHDTCLNDNKVKMIKYFNNNSNNIIQEFYIQVSYDSNNAGIPKEHKLYICFDHFVNLIKMSPQLSGRTYYLYNITGKVVQTGRTQDIIPVSFPDTGIFILKVFDNKKNSNVFRFEKMK